jgi:hypothetical protein
LRTTYPAHLILITAVCCFFIPLMYKHSQHFVLKYSQFAFFSYVLKYSQFAFFPNLTARVSYS